MSVAEDRRRSRFVEPEADRRPEVKGLGAGSDQTTFSCTGVVGESLLRHRVFPSELSEERTKALAFLREEPEYW